MFSLPGVWVQSLVGALRSLQGVHFGKKNKKKKEMLESTENYIQYPMRNHNGKIILKNDPAIPLLGIHTEETRRERDTCTPVFIAALFIIARTWKQPRCPSADEWMRKLWYIYTMEYYSAIKKNTFESVLMRWMKLEPIIQSEVSQKEKHQYSILMHIYGI